MYLLFSDRLIVMQTALLHGPLWCLMRACTPFSSGHPTLHDAHFISAVSNCCWTDIDSDWTQVIASVLLHCVGHMCCSDKPLFIRLRHSKKFAFGILSPASNKGSYQVVPAVTCIASQARGAPTTAPTVTIKNGPRLRLVSINGSGRTESLHAC